MFRIENIVVQDVIQIDALQLDESVISIEGQSGSGKSTLLRLLNNLDDPTSGTIHYQGELLTDIEPMSLRKKIVMVPQNPVVFDGTIRENLLKGLEFSGAEAVSDDRLKDLLEALWLDKDLETSASELSGGEKQRMALGRVLLMDQAEVFLLDEPSSDLDDETGNHVIREFINHASEQQQQTIMVTHDKQVTEQFAEQKINMDDYSMNIRKEAHSDGR